MTSNVLNVFVDDVTEAAGRGLNCMWIPSAEVQLNGTRLIGQEFTVQMHSDWKCTVKATQAEVSKAKEVEYCSGQIIRRMSAWLSCISFWSPNCTRADPQKKMAYMKKSLFMSGCFQTFDCFSMSFKERLSCYFSRHFELLLSAFFPPLSSNSSWTNSIRFMLGDGFGFCPVEKQMMISSLPLVSIKAIWPASHPHITTPPLFLILWSRHADSKGFSFSFVSPRGQMP